MNHTIFQFKTNHIGDNGLFSQLDMDKNTKTSWGLSWDGGLKNAGEIKFALTVGLNV